MTLKKIKAKAKRRSQSQTVTVVVSYHQNPPHMVQVLAIWVGGTTIPGELKILTIEKIPVDSSLRTCDSTILCTLYIVQLIHRSLSLAFCYNKTGLHKER